MALVAAPRTVRARAPVQYAGLTHTPLGNAELEVGADTLVVSNIGSGGLEGVAIDTEGAESVRVAWQDFSGVAGFNTLLQAAALGTTAGEAAETALGSLLVVPVSRDVPEPEPALVVEANFSPLMVYAYTFEVYNNGALVEAQTAEVPFIPVVALGASTARWPTSLTQTGGGAQRTGYALAWPAAQKLAFAFRNRDGPPAIGNELRLYAEDANGVVTLSGMELRLGDLPSLTIESETVGAGPP